MQSRESDLNDAVGHLQAAANRVAAVARVHQNFYSHDADAVSCIAFLRRLCADLSDILGKPIEIHGDDGNVPTTKIQPIGLLVNELVTNAAKHGTGKIDVSYRISGGVHILSVCDEGEGLPTRFEPEKSIRGLGMKVVSVLTKQLGGRMIAGSSPIDRGSCFTVEFPA